MAKWNIRSLRGRRSSEMERALARADQLNNNQLDLHESDSDVLRSTGTMAIATLISRITGFIRNVMLGASLGAAVFSAFNTASQLPNLITEIVLGAVLTSLVVPVLVRAEKEDPDHGAAFVRRLITASSILLGVVTLLCIIGAPLLVRLSLSSTGRVNVFQSTNFAYYLMPEIFFYGISALLMAILNTKGVFRPGAWAPVWNNVVCIVVLTLYWVTPGSLAPDDNGSLSNPHIMLLGIGITAGVVVQALVLIPPLRRIGVDLRPLWGIDKRVKELAGMGVAIIVYVAISQAGYFITNRIASGAAASAPGIYSQAWLLMQMPYGIIGVTLLTAIMPRLSRHAADNDRAGVVRDLTVGSKLTMIGILPVVMFFIFFGPQIGVALYAYGRFGITAATTIGLTLSLSAFALIPYSLVLLHLRVFYAREEAWTPTFIIIAITTTKVILSVLAVKFAPSPETVVILLGMANGFGFLAGTCIGAYLLRRSIKTLNATQILTTSLWVVLCSVVGALAAFGVDHIPAVRHLSTQLGSPGMILRVGIAGVITMSIAFALLSRTPIAELATLERVLGRLPGPLGRHFLARAASRPPTVIEEAESAEETEEEILVAAADQMSEALDGGAGNLMPINTNMALGLRTLAPDEGHLLPGAYVRDGRFRLISYQGKTKAGDVTWLALDCQNDNARVLLVAPKDNVCHVAPAAPVSSADSSDVVVLAAGRKGGDGSRAGQAGVGAVPGESRATFAFHIVAASIVSITLVTLLGLGSFLTVSKPLSTVLQPSSTSVTQVHGDTHGGSHGDADGAAHGDVQSGAR